MKDNLVVILCVLLQLLASFRVLLPLCCLLAFLVFLPVSHIALTVALAALCAFLKMSELVIMRSFFLVNVV